MFKKKKSEDELFMKKKSIKEEGWGEEIVKRKSKSKRKILVIVLISVFILAAAILSRYYIYPKVFGSDSHSSDVNSAGSNVQGSKPSGGGGSSGSSGGSSGGSGGSKPSGSSSPTSGGQTTNKPTISSRDITYLLEQIGANGLHNPMFSSDTPEIEVVVDGVAYAAEVVKGSISVIKGKSNDPDIRITTSAEEVFAAKNSGDVRGYIKQSVINRNTWIDTIASKTNLFAKGYLKIYESFQ